MSSGLDAIPNIDHCQQLVLSYAILNHVVLHSALHMSSNINCRNLGNRQTTLESWYPWNQIINNLPHQPLSIVHVNVFRHNTTKQLDWPVNAVETKFLSS